MVLLPLLFPFRPATAYVPTHESTTLAADPNLNLETPTSASGITSVYGNSGIGPGVFISKQNIVLGITSAVSLYSKGVKTSPSEEPLKITSAPLNKVALSSKKVRLYA